MSNEIERNGWTRKADALNSALWFVVDTLSDNVIDRWRAEPTNEIDLS